MISKLEIDENGTKRWFNSKGQYHRENGAAIIYLDGEMYWYINDKFHRIDGPAWVYSDGDKYWRIKGEFIRAFIYD